VHLLLPNNNNYFKRMKKFLLILVPVFLLSCEKEPEIISCPVEFNLDGKWLYSLDSPMSASGISNTMYIFEAGTRYTYYCADENCDSLYDSFQAADGNHIPETNSYNFSIDTLSIDINFGNTHVLPLIFECGGNIINFQDPISPDRYNLYRLGTDLDSCN
tara:strand:+ start:488 stop:967 length:480 start_codon:yes stop_codon:yes gene_type:complete